jgi:hypothetical protein
MKKATTGQVMAEGAVQGSTTFIVALSSRINRLHHEVKTHETQMLLKARNAGKLLLEVKRNVKHGEYLAWLEDNFEGSQATAWRYTRIAERWDVIAANYSNVNNLSIAEALKLVRYGYGRGRA